MEKREKGWKRNREVQRGLEQLRGYGVSIDDPSPTIVNTLNAHLGKGRETDLAIIFLLGRIADPAALEHLTSIEQTATDKEIKREARRSLYRLAQRGIAAPRPEQTESDTRKPIFTLGPEIEGYLSSVDSSGGRLVWLAKPQAGSGIQLLQGAVNDREGLVRFGGVLIRRKELRRMAQDIKERHGITMISVPWEYADQVLYDAYEKAKDLQRSELEEFPSLRVLFNSGRPKPLPHPIYNRLSADSIRSGAWRELSQRLLEEPEFRVWVLDEDWLKAYLEQVQEAEESRLLLNDLQKQGRLSGIVRDAVREIFSGERGKLFQRRMEDMALYLMETKREEEAKLALAVAVAIGEGDLGGLGALDISFLTVLIQKSLAFYLSQAKAKTAEEPSLIIKP